MPDESVVGTEERRVAGILIRVTPARRQAIFDEIERLSTSSPSFFLMVAVSTLIAAYGLLANSTAVIIGAMLVAPLMGPIFGVALSLAVGDQRLLIRAIVSEVAGMMLVIVLAMLIGLVPVHLGYGSEILARTQPTIYDIVIAIASGIAGSYAMVDEHLNAALPGVAISTALVPPLATCGLALAAMRWDWAGGALLLFFANFLAIHVITAIIFIAFGVRNIRVDQRLTIPNFFRRFSFSLAALVIIAVFLTQTLIVLWKDWYFSTKLQEVLSYQVRSRVGAQLHELKKDKSNDQVEVLATVLTPNAFEPDEVAQIEKVLRQQVDPHISLIMRSIISKDYNPQGPVYVHQEELEQRSQVSEQTSFLRTVSQCLEEQIKKIPGARMGELQLEPKEEYTLVTVEVLTHKVINPPQVAVMEKVLQQATKRPLQLIVRSILTRDADSHHYHR